MLRILMLVVFVAVCSTALVAGNLWAGGDGTNSGPKKFKKHDNSSFNSLAKALKSSSAGIDDGKALKSSKKDTDKSKVTSKKSSSASKFSKRASKSKKTLTSKSKKSSKQAHLKSGSHHKSSYGVRTRSPKKARTTKNQRSASLFSEQTYRRLTPWATPSVPGVSSLDKSQALDYGFSLGGMPLYL